MKTKSFLLILSMITSSVSFLQDNKQPKEIYFEGTVIAEFLGDGTFYITVEITKGNLIGKTETLYFIVGFGDKNKIECIGDAKFDGAGYSKEKIKGKIVESTGFFEGHDIEEGKTKKCYRPVELNWM